MVGIVYLYPRWCELAACATLVNFLFTMRYELQAYNGEVLNNPTLKKIMMKIFINVLLAFLAVITIIVVNFFRQEGDNVLFALILIILGQTPNLFRKKRDEHNFFGKISLSFSFVIIILYYLYISPAGASM